MIKRNRNGQRFQATSAGSVGFKFGKRIDRMGERQSRCCFLAYRDCRSTCSSLVVVSCFLSIPFLLEAHWALHCTTAMAFLHTRGLRIHKSSIGPLVVLKMVTGKFPFSKASRVFSRPCTGPAKPRTVHRIEGTGLGRRR